MKLVIAVLSRMSKATTDTVVNVDSSIAVLFKFFASGSFLIVDWLDVRKAVEVTICGVISIDLRVVHHLGTSGADSYDLAKMSSLFDKAVKLFADTLDLVIVRKISMFGYVPAVNVDCILCRMAKTTIAGAISISTRGGGAGFTAGIVGDAVDGIVRVGPSVRPILLSGGSNKQNSRELHFQFD